MARSEARISVDIWAPESDFSELTSDAQWMYMFLLSQSDISHSGVLPLRERRWARSAKNLTAADISHRLDELAEHRYVVVDEDAEEVLVRSFIRGDKVYKQPNVLAAAKESLPLVTSPRIRHALAVEVRRIQELGPPDGSVTILQDMLKALGEPILDPSDIPARNPSGNPSEESSDEGSANPLGDRGVVTVVTTDSPVPDPLSPNISLADDHAAADDHTDVESGALFGAPPTPPEPPPRPHTNPGKDWPAKDIDADPKWVAFWQAYPSVKEKGHARKMWLKALRGGAEPDQLVEAALAYRNDPRRTAEYTKHAGTWLNRECWHDYDPKDVEPEFATPRPWWEN